MRLEPGETGYTCSFIVWGRSFDPEEFTDATAVVPDQVRMTSADDASVRYPRWEIVSALAPSALPGEHAEDVLRRVRPIVDRVNRYKGTASVALMFALYIDSSIDQNPGIHLHASDLRVLAQLDAEIDIDIYLLTDDSGVI